MQSSNSPHLETMFGIRPSLRRRERILAAQDSLSYRESRVKGGPTLKGSMGRLRQHDYVVLGKRCLPKEVFLYVDLNSH